MSDDRRPELRIKLGSSDLEVFPLCLGGNVFGWCSDATQSFAVLDAYVEAGGNFLDTADSYSFWAPGNRGGESEEVIGRWLAARGIRDELVIATKVGQQPGFDRLDAVTLPRAVDESLRRLGTDRIDLYWAHVDDEATPLDETLTAFGALVESGKVRAVGVSNWGPERLVEALTLAGQLGVPRFSAVQPLYNLMDRDAYESGLAAVCAAEGLACVPFAALAKGFLTGKYRAGGDVDSVRADDASSYLDDRGRAVLEALDAVAASHGAPVAAVSLAWLAAQPTVVAPIAAARIAEQVPDLVAMAGLQLTDEELARLTQASSRHG